MSECKNIYEAMFNIQKEMEHRIVRSVSVSYKQTKYKFSPIEDIFDKIKPFCEKYGILILQYSVYEYDEDTKKSKAGLKTVIRHIKSSTQVSGVLYIDPGKPGGQEAGKVITYGRRYSLCSIFNITPVIKDKEGNVISEDDDCAPEGVSFFHNGKKSKPELEYDGPTTKEVTKSKPINSSKKSSGLKKTNESVDQAAKSNFADE